MWSTENEQNYLAHHGILGMKWGVRRYQNEDGSLTNAGKKRYGDSSEKSNRSKSTDRSIKDKAIKVKDALTSKKGKAAIIAVIGTGILATKVSQYITDSQREINIGEAEMIGALLEMSLADLGF